MSTAGLFRMRLAGTSQALRRLSTIRRPFCTSTTDPPISTAPTEAPTKSGIHRISPYQKPESGRKLDSQKGVLEFIDIGTSAGARRNGRAWRTAELRLKSFDDLHKLWFILLKERNVLLSEKAWCKTNGHYWENGPSNLVKVKQSMGRIKGVLGERERALAAKKVAEAMKEEAEGRGLGDAADGDAADGDAADGKVDGGGETVRTSA